MATTTTNYGFDVPTSSDLVKNGATQIALLGQDLDTFLFRPFTRNACINGGMDIWQRGTSFTSTNALGLYGADRWQIYSATTGRTYSRQASGLTGFQYAMRVQRDSGNSNTTAMQLIQNLESADSIRFAGQSVTISFYARAGANCSDLGLDVVLWSGTGTDQSILSGYTGQAVVSTNVATLTTSWQRFSYTATVTSSATQLGLVVNNTPTGTAGAADYWDITGVQIEVGSQVSPFIRAGGGSIQQELALCQRYYWRAGGDSVYQPYGVGAAQTGTVAQFSVQNPVPMRVAPTSIDFSTLAVTDTILALSVSALTFANAGKYASSINATSSTMVIYRPYILVSNNSTSGFFGLSAEL